MNVKFYKSLGDPPEEHRAAIVIIEDKHGNPISFVSEHGDYYVFSDVSRDDFQRMLQSVGLDKTVIVTQLSDDRRLALPE